MNLLPPLVLIAAMAQAAGTSPQFDVASIRPIGLGLRAEESIENTPGVLTMRSVTLNDCIGWAYDVEVFQISDPAWLGDSRFDISARAADAADNDQLRLMLQTLLADRFGLKIHRDQKEMSVYRLVVARGGPKFHDAGPKDPSEFVESTGSGPSSFREDYPGLIAERVRMGELASKLPRPLQRPVIDKTGLEGRYDVRIDLNSFRSFKTGEPSDPVSIVLATFPSQLGLKLESGREALDFLTVDSVNKTPTEN